MDFSVFVIFPTCPELAQCTAHGGHIPIIQDCQKVKSINLGNLPVMMMMIMMINLVNLPVPEGRRGGRGEERRHDEGGL